MRESVEIDWHKINSASIIKDNLTPHGRIEKEIDGINFTFIIHPKF